MDQARETRAAIDLGTNTCLLVIADVLTDPSAPPSTAITRGDWLEVVRLGEGVAKSGALQAEPMERALSALREYSKRVREFGLNPQDARCVATAQARDASNGAQFFARVQNETGFRFRVISGNEEARLTFLGGLLPGMDPKRTAVIDIGGGSTEIARIEGGKSLQLGSVRMTEMFFAPGLQDLTHVANSSDLAACEFHIDTALNTAFARGALRDIRLVGVAGTVTTIAQWCLGQTEFDAAALDGYVLSIADVKRAVDAWRILSPAQRRGIAGMEAKRADVILAGAIILWRAMEYLGARECTVSTRGLRYGALTLSRTENDSVI